jgi:hypothetical protein
VVVEWDLDEGIAVQSRLIEERTKYVHPVAVL